MSCEDNCCGTGLAGNNIPKPGDPDNNVSLSATTVYGGISVSWSFPTTNPQAVAHTILYRNTSNNFSSALELGKIGGSIYFDSLNPTQDTVYWYWIRFRTVNGTLLDQVGPVSATAKVRGVQTLESLTGLIDAGVLAQELKTSIAGISLQGQQLLQEITDRIHGNSELSGLIAAVQSGQQDAMTYVQNEIIQRTTADSAIVQMVNTIAAAVGQNTAAIFTETEVRTDKDSAMATQITTLFASTASNQAAIQNEVTVRTNAVSAIATQVSTLTSRVGNSEATIQAESSTRATADSALASRITTTESTVNGNVATGQIGLSTKITTLDGKVTSIGALYTAKVQVNGLIGGFGVYNDGTFVEAGFDVDRFWIGRTSAGKVKPFIIDNGIVYMDKARIRDADIDTLKIAGNAVTVPQSAYTEGLISGQNLTAQSISVVSSGSPALLTFGTHCYSDFHEALTMELLRDGSVIFSCGGGGMETQMQGQGMETATVIDRPGAGSHQYILRISSPGHTAWCSSRCITYMEIKR